MISDQEKWKAIRILDDTIVRTTWFEKLIGNMMGNTKPDLTREREDLEWLLKLIERIESEDIKETK